MRSADVLVTGEYYCDLIYAGLPGVPKLGAELVARDLAVLPGGTYNIALALTRLGLDTHWACDFGSDLFSGLVLEQAARDGLSPLLFNRLDQPLRRQTFFRVVYFLPVVTSTIAAALVWAWLFNSNFGLINAGLSLVGVTDLPKWMGSTRWAMPAIIIVSIWQNLGYAMVLFLAGLQNIGKDVHDAAALDGATGWDRFWHVTLPLLSPTTFFVLVISIIGSFQVFELVLVMTKAGPANATNTLVYYIYQNGFQFYQMGYASAAAMVLFLIVLAFTLIQYKLQRRWVHHG